MPANDDLRSSPPMLRGDLDDHRLAEQTAAPERTPGFRSDPSPDMELPERPLLKARMKLDLIDCGRNASLSDDSLDVLGIEIRNPDRPDPTVPLETNERLPTLNIAVDPGPRPMDQVQIESVAVELLQAILKSAQRFVEAVIRIAEFRGDEDIGPADQSVADAFLVSIHGRRVDGAITFVDGHFDDLSRRLGGSLEDPKPELRHRDPVVEDHGRLGLVSH
jgi:hypothetical protein